MSSLQSAEIATRRMSASARARTYVPLVKASDFGDARFVDFLADQARNPFVAGKIVAELQSICNEGRRLDSALWQIFKMARYTVSQNEEKIAAFDAIFA